MSFLGGSSAASSASSGDIKNAFMQQMKAESAMNNARLLVQKINENCFSACITNPGSSLSSQENTCLTNCMEKYIGMWNITSRTYISRISVESKRMGGDASAIGALGTGAGL